MEIKQKDSNREQRSYCCVSCGATSDELWHQYRGGAIKIIHCKECKNPVDPYIELDVLLVFIDFVLLKLRAHRHVLFNIDQIQHDHIFKLFSALILTNAYMKWFHLKNDQYQSILNRDHQIFYALEYGFYWKLLESIIEYSIRFGLIALFVLFFARQPRTKSKFENFVLLSRAMILSSIGQLFVLPLLIWSPDNRDYYGLLICSIFTILCHSQALNAGRYFSIYISFICSMIAVITSQWFVKFVF